MREGLKIYLNISALISQHRTFFILIQAYRESNSLSESTPNELTLISESMLGEIHTEICMQTFKKKYLTISLRLRIRLFLFHTVYIDSVDTGLVDLVYTL
jgi:hypothetical protein